MIPVALVFGGIAAFIAFVACDRMLGMQLTKARLAAILAFVLVAGGAWYDLNSLDGYSGPTAAVDAGDSGIELSDKVKAKLAAAKAAKEGRSADAPKAQEAPAKSSAHTMTTSKKKDAGSGQNTGGADIQQMLQQAKAQQASEPEMAVPIVAAEGEFFIDVTMEGYDVDGKIYDLKSLKDLLAKRVADKEVQKIRFRVQNPMQNMNAGAIWGILAQYKDIPNEEVME